MVGDARARPWYGRDRELDLVAGLFEYLRHGAGGVLVVRGVAGIGKSSLLAVAAISRAADHGTRVLSAVGVQSELRLPFSGLHQLLRPVLQWAEGLPARQRAALLAAFGMSDEIVPGLFLIALATLDLANWPCYRGRMRASGETSRRRRPEAWDRFTPQELQIARMAAEGLSNREIGQ